MKKDMVTLCPLQSGTAESPSLHTSFYVALFCWQGSEEWETVMCTDIKHLLIRVKPHESLLYYRQFGEMFEALGHKLLLDHLSRDSLMNLVRRTNHEMKDRRSELL